MNYIPWNELEQLDTWLDSRVSEQYLKHPLAQDWARISKIGEEYGEAVQAFIGYTGQNPRKGFTHDYEDVINELADTLFTALLAIQHMTKDIDTTRTMIEKRWEYRMFKVGLANQGPG
jgi:NTP pyrophosphatase (non-canonical NTP hydrolase)